MNEVRVLTAVLILGLAPIACTRTTATPTTDAAAESERATREYAHGALIQTPTPTVDATAIADAMATGQALPRDPTAEEMRDGRHFGSLKAMRPGSPPMLVVDPAVMFGGDEADAASMADEVLNEHELPMLLHIRDLDTTTVTLPISTTAVSTLILNAEDHLDMATARCRSTICSAGLPERPSRRWMAAAGTVPRATRRGRRRPETRRGVHALLDHDARRHRRQHQGTIPSVDAETVSSRRRGVTVVPERPVERPTRRGDQMWLGA
ncbi:MAG: hypothetical protein U0470_09465 [Anaerolineae bacterium]